MTINPDRYVVAYGKARGIVFVKDTTTGELVSTWAGDDALLDATEDATRRNRQDTHR